MKKSLIILMTIFSLAGCAERVEQGSYVEEDAESYIGVPVTVGVQGVKPFPVEAKIEADKALPVKVGVEGDKRLPVELQVQEDKRIPVRLVMEGEEKIPVVVEGQADEGKPVKVELRVDEDSPLEVGVKLDRELSIKADIQSDKALPVEIKVPGNVLMLSMISVGVLLIIAIAACFGALAGWRSASKLGEVGEEIKRLKEDFNEMKKPAK
ncbi:MAG: hypothetical protein ACYS9Y_01080 [Planctomycetota bacterium]|jgi:hypothetical protein